MTIAERYQRFWWGLELSPARLRLFRFAFFFLVGLEAFLQISSAPRFGIGDFNVPHFPFLFGALPSPTRAFMLVAYLVLAYAALRVSFDVPEPPLMWGVAAGVGALYFISQLDSYQHHYLVFLLALLAGFARERGPGARLLLMQVSLVYLWAAVAKFDPVWLDGSALRELVPQSSFAPRLLAIGILVVECFLAVALQIPRLWPPALLVGVPFHIAIEISHLEIGLFSYFMLSVYLLLLPERWLRFRPRWPAVPHVPFVFLALGSALFFFLPFDESWLVALLVTALGLLLFLRWQASIGHLAACAVLVVLAHTTPVVTDYYRFWGGSSRRLGRIETALEAYRRLTEIRPDYPNGWAQLAALYQRTERPTEARAAAERALALDPDNRTAREVLAAPAD